MATISPAADLIENARTALAMSDAELISALGGEAAVASAGNVQDVLAELRARLEASLGERASVNPNKKGGRGENDNRRRAI